MIDQEWLWNERSRLGPSSGTKDLIARELEVRSIERHVQDGMRVLDVGCGDGATLMRLAKNHSGEFLGIDPAEDMVKAALETNLREQYGPGRIWFEVGNVLTWEPRTTYDLILTQRCLINLPDVRRQQAAIRRILSWLKPGGKFLMCECVQEGLDGINDLRQKVGLPKIVPPEHNRYLVTRELRDLATWMWEEDQSAFVDMVEYPCSTYALASRVFNAKLAMDAGTDPDYDSPLNRTCLELPSIGHLGQNQCWVWQRVT